MILIKASSPLKIKKIPTCHLEQQLRAANVQGQGEEGEGGKAGRQELQQQSSGIIGSVLR